MLRDGGRNAEEGIRRQVYSRHPRHTPGHGFTRPEARDHAGSGSSSWVGLPRHRPRNHRGRESYTSRGLYSFFDFIAQNI